MELLKTTFPTLKQAYSVRHVCQPILIYALNTMTQEHGQELEQQLPLEQELDQQLPLEQELDQQLPLK